MRSSRQGFTLYQLIALIAMLVIAASFLAPLIARFRYEAQRSQSQNNLKQLGLAMHNYHDVWGKCPSGNDGNNFSAAAHMLPFIEQQRLHRLINFKQDSTAKVNAAVRQTVIPTFLSPLDPQKSVQPNAGATNYLFSAGTMASLQKNNGIFFQDSALKLFQIPDGTSNTIAIMETLKGAGNTNNPTVKRHHVALQPKDLVGLKLNAGTADFKQGKNLAGDRCASWMDGRFLMGTINGGRAPNDPQPDVNCEGQGGWGGPRGLTKMVNIAICDGSVRSIDSTKITKQTWERACDRNDGQVLGADW